MATVINIFKYNTEIPSNVYQDINGELRYKENDKEVN